jgi:hypothetical protein
LAGPIPKKVAANNQPGAGNDRRRETLPLKVDESRRLYRQIAKHLRNLIDSGEYPIGGRLPSERELADRLQVSRTSVREAGTVALTSAM